MNAAALLLLAAAALGTRAPLALPFRPASRPLAEKIRHALLSGSHVYYEMDVTGRHMAYALPRLDFEREEDLRLLGALTQRLPADFAETLDRAVAATEPGDPAVRRAVEALQEAHARAKLDVVAFLRERGSSALRALDAGEGDEAVREVRALAEKGIFYGNMITLLKFQLEDLPARVAAGERAGAFVNFDVSKADSSRIVDPVPARQRKDEILASAHFALLPEGPGKEALRSDVERGVGRQEGRRPDVRVLSEGEIPAIPQYYPILAEQRLGRPLDGISVIQLVLDALEQAYPDAEFRSWQNDKDGFIGIDEGSRAVFKLHGKGVPKRREPLLIYFSIPHRLSYGQETVFLRRALLRYGLAVTPLAGRGAYRLGPYVLAPEQARALATH